MRRLLLAIRHAHCVDYCLSTWSLLLIHICFDRCTSCKQATDISVYLFTHIKQQKRTLLILRDGKSVETPYHREHLHIKPGFWCMHKNEVKFLVTSRFISSEKIDVVTALSFEDSPVILRTEFHRAINQTVASLRKLNGILNNAEASIPGRTHAHIHGTF